MLKFTIIVLSYNSELLQILLTLKSIIEQDIIDDLEIIIADDGSKKQWKDEIKNYFAKNNITKYKFAPSSVNLGTVGNILRALEYSSSNYIKLIGAGDLLFDNTVISQIYDFMCDENCKCAFGKLVGYSIKQQCIKNSFYTAPLSIRPYKKRNQISYKKNIIIEEDNISGASMFFEKNFLHEKLKEISGIVKYTEDLIQVLAVLENEELRYVPQNVVLYEVGTGISTNIAGNQRLRKDINNFWYYIYHTYSDPFLEKRKKRFQMPKIYSKLSRYIESPDLTLKSFKRKYIDIPNRLNAPPRNLGFLDNNNFICEFKLKRR